MIAQDTQRSQKLASLEVGRAVAACLVLMHHATLSANEFTSGPNSSFLKWGYLGVDFFFVLSGFIIYHVHCHDQRTPVAARRFLKKRILRIYIPYLPVSIAMMAAYLLLPDISLGNRDWSVFTSLTLIPSERPPALSVAWTLTYEMVFYVAFLTFYISRYFWVAFVIWGVSILSLFYVGVGYPEKPFINVLTNLLVLEFLGGVLAAWVFQRMRPEKWYWPFGLGMVLLFLSGILEEFHRVYVGIALAPLTLGLALSERHYRYSIPDNVLLLGASSYAIYLVHSPIISVLSRALANFESWLLLWVASVSFGIVAGLIYHLIFEKPALQFLNTSPVILRTRRAKVNSK